MKFNILQWKSGLAASALALLPGTAHAQAWIGQVVGNMIARENAAATEYACMNGTPMPDGEVIEARQPAIGTMNGYFAAARDGSPVASHFHLDKHSRWISRDASLSMAGIGSLKDPFASAGLALDAAPLGFVRAGDGASALGQWAARDAAGAQAGIYTGRFLRKGGVWRLSTLELTGPDRYVDPVVQYCHAAGDVMPFRLTNTRRIREALEKRVAKTEAKAKEAQARISGTGGTRTASTVARAQRLTNEFETRRKELAVARDEEAKALADSKAAEEAKAAAETAFASGG